MHPRGIEMLFEPRPTSGLARCQDRVCWVLPAAPPRRPPGWKITLAGPGRLRGNHFSTRMPARAPRRQAKMDHELLLFHLVEDLVESLLGHVAFLLQLVGLHGGASIPQHLQDPLPKVWEKRERQRELRARNGAGPAARGAGEAP